MKITTLVVFLCLALFAHTQTCANLLEEANSLLYTLNASPYSYNEEFNKISRVQRWLNNLNSSTCMYPTEASCYIHLNQLFYAGLSKREDPLPLRLVLNETIRIFNASCVGGSSVWFTHVKEEETICANQVGTIYKMLGTGSPSSETQNIYDLLEDFFQNPKCVFLTDCPKCRKWSEFLYKLFARGSENRSFWKQGNKHQFLLQFINFLQQCAVRSNSPGFSSPSCENFDESSAYKAERIEKYMSGSEITSYDNFLERRALLSNATAVLTVKSIQWEANAKYCKDNLELVRTLTEKWLSIDNFTAFDSLYVSMSFNIYKWMKYCAVYYPNKPTPTPLHIYRNDWCANVSNNIIDNTTAIYSQANFSAASGATNQIPKWLDRIQMSLEDITNYCLNKNASYCPATATIVRRFYEQARDATQDAPKLNNSIFLYSENVLRFINYCLQEKSAPGPTPTPPSPPMNGSCRDAIAKFPNNIATAIEDSNDYFALMNKVRAEKSSVETFTKCVNDSERLKNPTFCKSLTQSFRALFVRATFASDYEELRQRAATLLSDIDDLLYECGL